MSSELGVKELDIAVAEVEGIQVRDKAEAWSLE